MAGSVGTAYVDVELDPTGIRRGLARLRGEVTTGLGDVQDAASAKAKDVGGSSATGFRQGFLAPLKGMGPAFEKAFVPALGGLAAVGVGAKKAMDAASDLNESTNAVTVTFGRAGKQILDFGKTAATDVGLSMRELNELVTPVGASLRNAGFGADAAAKSSIALTKRAADMASVFNTSVPEALEAIQSGLRGEADPLERFGVGLSDAAVKAKGVQMGLKLTDGALSANGKAQARIALLMEQTNRLQGDFANTSGGAANSQRILRAQVENLEASLGQALLPAFGMLVGFLSKLAKLIARNQKAFKVLIAAFTAFAAIIVVVNVAMKAYAAAQVIIRAATVAWTAVQWLLNAALAANPIALVVIALAALAAGLVLAWKYSDTFREKVTAAFDAVLGAAKTVWKWIEKNWPYLLGALTGPFGLAVVAIVKNFDTIKGAVTKALDAVRNALSTAARTVGNAAASVGSAIANGIVRAVTGVGSAVWTAVSKIGAVLNQYANQVLGWGRSIGARIVSGIVSGLSGVGAAAWNVINNIWSVIQQYANAIRGWGTSVGTWIKNAVVSGVTGVGSAVWNVVNNVWSVLSGYANTVKGWGTSVGTWIRNAIVAAFTGLGKLIRDAIRKAIKGIGGKIGGAVLGAVGLRSAPVPPPTGPMQYAPGPMEAASAGLRAGPVGASAEGGALAGPVPFGAQLTKLADAIAPTAAVVAPQPLEVRVFIGETELRGIVRTEVRSENAQTADVLLAGVR